MQRILIVTPHGLGDNVMLTPALRKYKEKNPNSYITVAGLERFGRTLKNLLSGLPFIDEVVTILPDPWESGPEKYGEKVKNEVLPIADKYGGENQYTKGIFLPTNKQEGHRLHKIFRFESEVGVSFNCIEDLQTELHVSESYIEKADKFLSSYKRPIALFHNDAGNPPKEFKEDEVDEILSNFQEYSILEFGKDIAYDDMEFSKSVIRQADLVVAIDSIVMHIAGAFKKELVALFKSTPAHQALPLTYNVQCLGYTNEVTQLELFPKYRYMVSEIYGFPKFSVGDPIIIEGEREKKDFSFNYDKYKKMQFEVEEYEGEPRLTLEAHGDEAIKFFKEVEKYLPNENSLSDGAILDVGGNTGYHSKMLSEKYNREVTMIDINPELVKIARKNCEGYNVKCKTMDIHDMKLKNKSFSFIFAKDVLEHSYDPDKVLSKMFKLLCDNGVLLAFIPFDGSARDVPSIDLNLVDGYKAHPWKTTFKDCETRFRLAGFNDVTIHKLNISDITGRKRQFGDEAGIVIVRKNANKKS